MQKYGFYLTNKYYQPYLVDNFHFFANLRKCFNRSIQMILGVQKVVPIRA